MPPPACAVPLTVTGGQAAAQAPEQVDMPLVSASHRYSARPFPSTSALPSIPVMDFRLTVTAAALADAEAAAAGLLACAAADAGADDAGGPAAVLPEPLEQAVAVSATAAAQAAAAIQFLIMVLPVVGVSREPAVPGGPGCLSVPYRCLRARTGSGSGVARCGAPWRRCTARCVR